MRRGARVPGDRAHPELARWTECHHPGWHRVGHSGDDLGRKPQHAQKFGAPRRRVDGTTAANYSGRLIDIVYAKGMFARQAWVEFARWNAISRVEVDRQGQAKAIVIDADASTYIMNADPAQWHGTAGSRH